MAQKDFKYLYNAEEYAAEQRARGLVADIKQIKLGRYPWRVYSYKK